MIYPWLEQHWHDLQMRQEQGRLPHALLLLGPDHFGIEDMVRELAQAVLCSGPGVTACHQCSSCRWFAAGTHPDYTVISPSGASQTIKIDAIRDLAHHLSKKSAAGGYQVVFIESADTLQVAGSNALLKTLEEPMGRVLFVLWAKRTHGLPATILSRTQQISLSQSPAQPMKTWLQEQGCSEPDKWLAFSQNRPLLVQSLQDNDFLSWRDKALDCMLRVRQGRLGVYDAVDMLSDWDRLERIRALESLVSDGMRSAVGIPNISWTNADKSKELSAIFEGISPSVCANFYKQVKVYCRYEYLPQSLNKGLLDCQFWLRWKQIVRGERC